MRALVVTGTTTQAADIMGLTQSAVSRLIGQLEDDLGFVLFDRHRGRLAITPEGPAIIECNDNPFHTLYQQAFRRGVRNPEFEAVFEKVGALSARMLADRQERIKARKNARKG